MISFWNKERVKIVDLEHPLFGRRGTVSRMKSGENWAWVAIDPPDIDAVLALYPVGHSLRNCVKLYPDQCERA